MRYVGIDTERREGERERDTDTNADARIRVHIYIYIGTYQKEKELAQPRVLDILLRVWHVGCLGFFLFRALVFRVWALQA